MQMAAGRCPHPSSKSIPRLLWKPASFGMSLLWGQGRALQPRLSPAGKGSWEIAQMSREPDNRGSQTGFECCPQEEFPEPGRSSCSAEHPPNALGWPGAAAGPTGAAEMPGLPLIPAVLVPAAHLRDGDESPDR